MRSASRILSEERCAERGVGPWFMSWLRSLNLRERYHSRRPQRHENRNGRRVSPDLPATVVAIVTVVSVIPIMPMVPPVHLVNDGRAIDRGGLQGTCLTHGGIGVCSDGAQAESNCAAYYQKRLLHLDCPLYVGGGTTRRDVSINASEVLDAKVRKVPTLRILAGEVTEIGRRGSRKMDAEWVSDSVRSALVRARG
jgi:hypothetical protein